ncbi:PulJ/GspJ family protein [Spongiivirga citrea]|uniref:Prepilin-type N-terminal cleavage/methylation domain-containing protein n=1 Tax=Spongiivirga citrea TaxID=1481457 RepID=A0A6M0CG31_9FLAO|nr:type II secretion system protein [Spongiivirga citrea]NER16791.1 prepilin-type N-terminal cleavage/methylation domain-containing protein [Spongiivirga citrea]
MPIKKVKAFTLSELLVVLGITTIVVAIAYLVLGLVQGNIFRLQQNYKDSTQVQQLQQALWIDLNTCNQATNSNIDGIIRFKNELDSVQYAFSDSLLVRYPDTFKINIEELKFYFDGTEIKNGNIDAIEVGVLNNSVQQSLFIFKENDAATYMNN